MLILKTKKKEKKKKKSSMKLCTYKKNLAQEQKIFHEFFFSPPDTFISKLTDFL